MDEYLLAKLEKVLGCTAISRSSLSVDENKGIIAYPAGSTVVLHNPKTNAQAHLIGTTRNSITCLAFSKCGRFLVTGEYGHEPKVRVWEIYDQAGQFYPSKVAELKLHKFGIVCVRFTPDGERVISVGNEYDKAIAISNWRKLCTVSENRLTSKVNALDISEQGNYYVTVGVRHVKFWYVTEKTAGSGTTPLQGRSAILAEQRNNTFVDVCCASNNRTFSITETNLLLEFRDKKLTGTYDLHGEMPRSLVLGGNEIFIGFNNGTIRCLDVDTMAHKFSYCKPHYLKCDVSKGTRNEVFLPGSHPPGCRYPDVRALCYNKSIGVLTAIYSDRSIYSWQRLENGNGLTKLSSQLFHVGAIYGLEVYPTAFSWLPAGSFISVGADNTVRIWNIDQRTKHFQSDARLPPMQTNVFSEELKKVIYLSDSANSLVENPESQFFVILCAAYATVFYQVLNASLADASTGIKALRLSPDGRHLAVGGKDGNVYVFDLTIEDIPQIVAHEAHENEVMCLEYSDQSSARYLLASGGRDRLVHLFDPVNNYIPLATVDDHTSALNSIIFHSSADGLELITCATDRLMVIRRLVESTISSPFGLNNVTMLGPHIFAACQDRQLRSYSLQGKLVRQVKGGISEEGQLTKVKLDPSGTFAATVSTDRSVYIVDALSGECAAVLLGQSDAVTDVAFTLDCRRLIVVSYSGCIFVWRLSNLLSSKMGTKLKKATSTAVQRPTSVDKTNDRSETPDSLIGSGSDGASEDIPGVPRYKLKDSESEFGSLTSLKIADEDDDSCIGQKPAKVVLNQADISSIDADRFGAQSVITVYLHTQVLEGQQCHGRLPNSRMTFSATSLTGHMSVFRGNSGFELRRVSTEVVRRSSSALNVHNSQWDVSSSANDDEGASGAGDCSSVIPSHALNQPNTSTMYVASRSMSNLRPGGTFVSTVGSPRRIRRKWDLADEGTSEYAAPVNFTQKPADMGSAFVSCTPNSSSHSLPPPTQTPLVQQSQDFMNVTAPSTLQGTGPIQLSSDTKLQPFLNKRLMAVNSGQNNSYLAASKQIDDAFQDPLPALSSPESNFDRSSSSRCSLTKRYMNSSASNDEPRSIRTPSSITARRATMNTQYPYSSETSSGILRRRSEIHSGNPRLYQQNGVLDASSDDSKSIRRARTMHRLKQRRLTIGAAEASSGEAKDEDYMLSDLYLRSRSQSPSHLALNALAEGTSEQRRRMDSDVSLSSSLASSRVLPSGNRKNLRSAEVTNKLNEMRDHLRKSHENLAGAVPSEASLPPPSAIMSRSRSIGNLRLSASALKNGQRPDLLGSRIGTGSLLEGGDFCEAGRRGIDSQTPLSSRSRFMARSVGSLHSHDSAESGSGESGTIRSVNLNSSSRLAQTMENLKKASCSSELYCFGNFSNPDLTQYSLYETVAADENSNTAPFSNIPPRFKQQGKGAVQKRVFLFEVERYQPRNRMSRDTTSGESDSNASDVNSSVVNGGNAVNMQSVPKRYFNPLSETNRCASSVETPLRFSSIQNTKRIFEPQRHNSSGTPRRVPNYLAQKFSANGPNKSDVGPEECLRLSKASLETTSLREFSGKTCESTRRNEAVGEIGGEKKILLLGQVCGFRDNLVDDLLPSNTCLMCESIPSYTRRTVKFADAPPEIVQFSYSRPRWAIPLASSASTSSISALKKALDDERQKSCMNTSSRPTALRRSVKLSIEAAQNWSLNRKKMLAENDGSGSAPRKDALKKRKALVVTGRNEVLEDERRPNHHNSQFLKMLSKSCDSLALLNVGGYTKCGISSRVIGGDELLATSATPPRLKNKLIKDAAYELMLKRTFARAKLRTVSRPLYFGTFCPKAASPECADSRWISEKFDFNETYENGSFEAKSDDDLEMARHIAECLEQFNTSLDKVLQARQLLESTQDLPPDDKDRMLRVLNQAIKTGRKRLEVGNEHNDSIESYNTSSNNVSTHRSR
ncbi:unnamed protein product [Enterobius vermicularis]|uniref:WD_REPEATS_REGION domain-containing protein n=1 Tax=Enterobius vermicularis TaxID=51028 RepID=A0A158QA12_ENTVE|nr:unnamed protein product [Enterobius vermicularis]